MRMIGTIPSDSDAERFSDYLVTLNMQNLVEQSAAGRAWDVWVENDDDLDRAKIELDAFLQTPADTKYNVQTAAGRIREELAKKRKKARARYVDVRTQTGQLHQWIAPVTIALIVLSIVITLTTNSMSLGAPARENMIDIVRFLPSSNVQNFLQWKFQNAPSDGREISIIKYWVSFIKAGQVWRLISPIFIHFGVLHLIFNLFWLRDLGFMIENRRGSWRFIGLVVTCAIVSNCAEFFWELPHLPNFGGMSGVVYGLFGYIWIKQRFEPYLNMGISQQTVWIMMVWLFVCMAGILGSVANAAHVMGLVTGAAIAFAPIGYRRMKRRLAS